MEQGGLSPGLPGHRAVKEASPTQTRVKKSEGWGRGPSSAGRSPRAHVSLGTSMWFWGPELARKSEKGFPAMQEQVGKCRAVRAGWLRLQPGREASGSGGS